MPSERHLFSLYHLDDQATPAALVAIELRESGTVACAQFQYLPEYLQRREALPVMPDMPLQLAPFDFACRGEGVPGFIDELVPDTWGRRLLTRLLAVKGMTRNPTLADLLCIPAGSPIGCFAVAPYEGMPPAGTDGLELDSAGSPIRAAALMDRNQSNERDLERLIQAGAHSLKGARPKLLVRDGARFWLAKLTRSTDSYDVLLAEHTALQIAREAGLEAPISELATLNGERTLLVERFDREADGRRRHLISANALLKDPLTQEDRMHAAYDDLADLIRRYSIRPAHDLRQLLGQALLNAAVRNTDDHLRNFSFLSDREGLRLSPAYDIVPTPVIGAYHQLNWGYRQILPTLEEGAAAARHLGLPAAQGKQLAEALRQAFANHLPALNAAGAVPGP